LKLHGKIVVWPANLDSTKSRKTGRRLAKGAALQTPRLEEINEAAKKLSIEPELVTGKSRPSTWWEKGGYLIFPKNEKRTVLLRSLSSEIRKARAAREKER
jgi:signal recognition particle subunit SRP19